MIFGPAPAIKTRCKTAKQPAPMIGTRPKTIRTCNKIPNDHAPATETRHPFNKHRAPTIGTTAKHDLHRVPTTKPRASTTKTCDITITKTAPMTETVRKMKQKRHEREKGRRGMTSLHPTINAVQSITKTQHPATAQGNASDNY